MGESDYHIPVLLKESVDGLNIGKGGVFVDVTFGGGGHSREILSRLDGGHLYSFDQDEAAEGNVEERDDFTFVRSNFRFLKNFMRYYGVEQVDGVLADLGVSSHHFDDSSRGFSFRFDGDLDMRMNRRAGKTAADVLNKYGEKELADLFYCYGELRQGRRIAAAVVARRREREFARIGDFIEVLTPYIGHDREKKDLAKAFQALRIEVNGELAALKEMLGAAVKLLRPGGRLSVITYHSLEDRIVKNVMRTGNAEGAAEKDFFGRTSAPLRLVSSKVILPGRDEVERNPRSRSAKLRIAEKL